MPRFARQKPIEEPDPVPAAPDPHMHRRKCTICRHPQRAEIERAFVDWTSPTEIANMFGLASRATVYRHARARGLFEIRRRNLHYGLGRIAEQVADVKPSAANVIAAFVAMAKINARGEWSNDRRFNTDESIDHARWELLAAAARENELEDTLAGDLAPVQAEQKRFRDQRDEFMAQAAAREAAKEAEQQVKAEKQAKEKKAPRPAEPKPRQKEEPKQEAPANQPTKPAVAAPPNPPAPPDQEKKPREPEERPHPIPQPPRNAPRLEDRGPYQNAGKPWPDKKITFARRRGRRPVVP